MAGEWIGFEEDIDPGLGGVLLVCLRDLNLPGQDYEHAITAAIEALHLIATNRITNATMNMATRKTRPHVNRSVFICPSSARL